MLIFNIKNCKSKKIKISVYAIASVLIIIMAASCFNDLYRGIAISNSENLNSDSITSNELAYQYISNEEKRSCSLSGGTSCKGNM